MNRPLLILVSALALGIAIFGSSFFAAKRATVICCTRSSDDLGWLRTEFHLSDAEMARIRELHEGYRPKCAEICAQISAKKSELNALVGPGTNLTAEATEKLNEISALEARCQAQMLQHFVAVSQAMPPEEGRRYLEQMKLLTLGLHQEMEDSTTGEPGHEHHH